MRFILSFAALLLVSWPAFGHGYGVPQQQFAPPVQYVPVPRTRIDYVDVPKTIIQRRAIQRTEIDYVPVQQAPVFKAPRSYCPPAAAFAPSYGVQASFGAGKGRGFLPGQGLFGGGRGQSTFRQRTFFRGQGGGVQAQFGAY